MKLTQPVMAHGESIAELTFSRRPKGSDIRELGLPYDVNGNVNTTAVSSFIARLANIPPSSVGEMDAFDWNEACGEVLGFFGKAPNSPSPDTTSTGAGTSPASSQPLTPST